MSEPQKEALFEQAVAEGGAIGIKRESSQEPALNFKPTDRSTGDNAEKTDEGDYRSSSDEQKLSSDSLNPANDSNDKESASGTEKRGGEEANGPPKKKTRAPRNSKEKFKTTHNPYSYYYFDSTDRDAVRCSTCPRAYKPSTRIDTLVRHLSKKHGVTSSAAIASGRANPFLLPGTGLPPSQATSTIQERTQMEEAVVNWILTDSLPLSVIETPAFLRLFRLAAPAAPLPSIQRLRELFSSMLEKAPQPSQPAFNFNGSTQLGCP
ncbi:hypothetical protein L0F63_006963 [Massospora cicadina]|nr:hypothetical protein L0F63_006963 [Massospora cicadina]